MFNFIKAYYNGILSGYEEEMDFADTALAGALFTVGTVLLPFILVLMVPFVLVGKIINLFHK